MSEKKHTVLEELEKREKLLAEHDEKMAKVEELTVEIESLKAELAENDVEILKVEIEEIKDICYKSGLLERPVEEVGENEGIEEKKAEIDLIVSPQPVVVSAF